MTDHDRDCTCHCDWCNITDTPCNRCQRQAHGRQMSPAAGRTQWPTGVPLDDLNDYRGMTRGYWNDEDELGHRVSLALVWENRTPNPLLIGVVRHSHGIVR